MLIVFCRDDAMLQSGNPVIKTSIEMENHVFLRAQSKVLVWRKLLDTKPKGCEFNASWLAIFQSTVVHSILTLAIISFWSLGHLVYYTLPQCDLLKLQKFKVRLNLNFMIFILNNIVIRVFLKFNRFFTTFLLKYFNRFVDHFLMWCVMIFFLSRYRYIWFCLKFLFYLFLS